MDVGGAAAQLGQVIGALTLLCQKAVFGLGALLIRFLGFNLGFGPVDGLVDQAEKPAAILRVS